MARRKKNKPKIVPYRRFMHINVGMVIFALIFLYMSVYVYAYIKREKIQFYEVTEGNIVASQKYTGIIFRDEEVQYAEHSGYLNYYVMEGRRAGAGARICMISEQRGRFALDSPEENSDLTLTDANYADIKRQLNSFVLEWSDMQFQELYDARDSVEALILEYVNRNAIQNLDALAEGQEAWFHPMNAPKSGIVSYSIDGFEALDPSAVNEALFHRTGNTRAVTKAGQSVEHSMPVYKLISSDDWSLVFPLDEEEENEYQGKTSLHIIFDSHDLETDGAFSIFTGSDGASYGRLDFDKYMVQFLSDRFLRFEVDMKYASGLKIPVTAVTKKSFYLVPAGYKTTGGDSSVDGFLKETYVDGQLSAVFVPTTIYYSTDEFFYIDMGENAPIQAGDYLLKPESSDRYLVGPSDALQGVYNINKGYAVFKQIDILSSNEEYCTIRKGMDYGLSVYDHIVLNAETVNEGEVVYQ